MLVLRYIPNRRTRRFWNIYSAQRIVFYALVERVDPVAGFGQQSGRTRAVVGPQADAEAVALWEAFQRLQQFTGRDYESYFVSSRFGHPSTAITSSLPRVAQDKLDKLTQGITDWIAPVGVLVDTVKSVYNRFHRYGELLAPDQTSQLDAWLAQQSDKVKAKLQPARDAINQRIEQAQQVIDGTHDALGRLVDELNAVDPNAGKKSLAEQWDELQQQVRRVVRGTK